MLLRNTLIYFCFFVSLAVNAQVSKHWIAFSDKNNSPFSLLEPEKFLTERAIERRKKFKIKLDSSDLPVNPAYLQAIKNTGAKILHTSKWFNGATIEVDNYPILLQVLNLPFVVSEQEVGKAANITIRERFEPKTNAPSKRKYLPTDYGDAFGQIALHSGDKLHNAGFTGHGMMIAVFDAGFSRVQEMFVFDSLFVENRIGPNRDFVQPGNPNIYNFDNHGTLVLSCMAANAPMVMIGTAPHAHYVLVRTENNINGSELIIEEENWVAGAEYADSLGVDIINSSLGYSTFDNPATNHLPSDMDGNTTKITQGADIAASKGILVVNSAGNYGSSPWKVITAPSDGDSVLAVGAIARPVEGMPLIRTNFSAHGLSGPDANGRVKPNVMAQGGQTTVANLNNTIGTSNGTSFSAPVMAGLVACLWQALPNKNNFEIIRILEKSGDRFNQPDSLYGYGIPNVYAAYLKNRLPDLSNQNLPLVIYPNPLIAGNGLWLWFKSGSNPAQIQLFDNLGKIVHQFTYVPKFEGIQSFELQIPVSLRSGIYVVRVNSGDLVYSAKFFNIP